MPTAAAEVRSFRPSQKSAPASDYVSQAKWAKPVPKTRKNFIPAQSWLGYSWQDKDPELDFVCFAIEQSGWSCEKIELETERAGHKVSRHTLLAWLYGSTKRPQNVTMNTVMSVLGYERKWEQR